MKSARRILGQALPVPTLRVKSFGKFRAGFTCPYSCMRANDVCGKERKIFGRSRPEIFETSGAVRFYPYVVLNALRQFKLRSETSTTTEG